MEGLTHISSFIWCDGRSSRQQAFAHLILHVVCVVLERQQAFAHLILHVVCVVLESPPAAHACSVISDSL